MSVRSRLVAIVVAVLAVIGVAVVAVNLADQGGGPVESAAAATATPSEAASTPGASASPLGEEETLAVLRRIEEQVVAIRGLPAADIGPPEVITRNELGDELRRIFDEDYPPDERERDTFALRALGLLEEGQDIAELQLQLLGDQVLGFYDDVDRRMVVVSDAGLDANARMTYAHEYAHALQDAAFDFASLEEAAGADEDDRSLARTAMIEGDASVVMFAWAFANLTQEELLDVALGTPLPDTTGIPAWMVAQVTFPYADGLNWATSLAGNPFEPQFGEIDAAFGDPPDSTEQIIHLDAWSSREAPVAVPRLDLAAALGEGWEEVDATPIGEAMIAILLEYRGIAPVEARAAGAGWGGDRAVIARGPDGAFALAWQLAWDSPTDADEFAAAYQTVVDGLGFPAAVTELDDGALLVAHASDAGLLDRVIDAAGG